MAVDIPTGIPTGVPADAIEQLVELLPPVFVKLSLLFGGLFGLYVLLTLIRVYYEGKKIKILKDIRYDLDQLNLHYNLPCSKTKDGFFRKVGNFFRSLFRRRGKLPKEKHERK